MRENGHFYLVDFVCKHHHKFLPERRNHGIIIPNMREMRITKIEGRIYLFPVPVVKQRKYLVACSSLEEAEKIITLIKEEKVTHPDLISEHFLFLTLHSDRQTKIFVLNPKTLH